MDDEARRGVEGVANQAITAVVGAAHVVGVAVVIICDDGTSCRKAMAIDCPGTKAIEQAMLHTYLSSIEQQFAESALDQSVLAHVMRLANAIVDKFAPGVASDETSVPPTESN